MSAISLEAGLPPVRRRYRRRAIFVSLGGALSIVAIALAQGFTLDETLAIVGIAVASAVLASFVGLLALRGMRRRSIGSQSAIVAGSAVVGAALGSWGVAQAMFLSGHDFKVLVVILATAGVASLLGSVLLGQQIRTASDLLVTAARQLDVAVNLSVEEGTASRELSHLARELNETSVRLSESQARVRLLEGSRRDLIAWISVDLDELLVQLEADMTSRSVPADAAILTNLVRAREVAADLAELTGVTPSQPSGLETVTARTNGVH